MFLFSLFTRRPKPPAAQRRPKKGWRPAEGITAQVALDGVSVPAVVSHLTAAGTCLALRLRAPRGRGDRLTLRLFNAACLHSAVAEARVTWCEPDGAACRVGCEFLSPLPPADLLPLLV